MASSSTATTTNKPTMLLSADRFPWSMQQQNVACYDPNETIPERDSNSQFTLPSTQQFRQLLDAAPLQFQNNSVDKINSLGDDGLFDSPLPNTNDFRAMLQQHDEIQSLLDADSLQQQEQEHRQIPTVTPRSFRSPDNLQQDISNESSHTISSTTAAAVVVVGLKVTTSKATLPTGTPVLVCDRSFAYLQAMARRLAIRSSSQHDLVWGDVVTLKLRTTWHHGADWWGKCYGPCQSHCQAPLLEGYRIGILPMDDAVNYPHKFLYDNEIDLDGRVLLSPDQFHFLTNDETELLCRLAGATIVHQDDWTHTPQPTIILVHDLMEKGLESFILPVDKQIPMVRTSWLVDSICANYVAPLSPYHKGITKH